MEQAQAKPKDTRAPFKSDDVNRTNKKGQSPLWIASFYGRLDEVKKLIEAGADVNQASKDNITPLYVASQNGHHDVVQTLLGAGAGVNIATSDDGRSPLWTASFNGHLEVVTKLIEAGADINQANKDNATPLFMASQKGHRDVVKTLLGAGAGVNIATSDDNVTPLYIASEQGHHEVVQTLLGAGAGVNIATSNDNATPLYVASQNGHDDVVQTLLGASAGVNIATSNDNVTPLYIAIQKGHRDVIQTLLGAGARVRSNDGSTPLDIAVKNGHKEIIELLKLNMSMDDGLTEQSNLKPSEIKQPVEHKEVVTFASTHGDNIRLEHGGQVACRFNNNSRGIVMTSAPLRSDVIFQVEIMEVDSKWSGSLSIGVTTQNTAQVVSVDNVKQLLGQSFIVTSSVNGKPSLALYAEGQEVDQLPDEINFHDLKVGDTVGLLYTNSGTLHLFMNGAHVVTLPCTVPVGVCVYGLVDLYGQCVKVSLRPLTPWSGGSPLHVMADKSTLDQQRKQLEDATELFEEAMKEGSVNISIIKCLVLGIAGVGKTHLKWLLLSENTDKHTGRVSTGIADNPVHAFVGSVKSILAGVDEKDTGNWEVLDESKLMQVLINAYQNEPYPISASVSIATQASPRPAVHQQPSRLADPLSKLHVDVKVPSPSSIEPVLAPSIQHQEISSDLPMEDKFNDNPAAGVISSRFIEAFKKARGKNVLHFKVTLVQFIDSGGQPQFLDILPAFIQDVSAIVFAVNLSESLDHCPEVYFYGQNSQPVGKPYTSPSSHKQVLEQCMRAFANNARGSHPYLFVMGTHRDEEQKCTETKKEKDEIIKRVANSEFLIHKTGVEAIWEVNSKTPEKEDEEVAHKLRRSIVANCSKGNHRHLPLKWFVLEMQIKASAPQGVLSLKMCLQQAQSLDMDENGLEAALLHMVKYNLFLWYHEVPGLREVVFSDPQVILKIITALVQCKHELAGRDDVPESFTSEGAKNDWCVNFRDHAIVRNEFLSHPNFQKHFIDGVFTVQHFTELMCHLFIMVPLENVNGYLMPALLDPLNLDDISIHQGPNPLLVCFPNEFAPHGLFSFLVAFLQHKECLLVENNKVPACLYRNCVSFKCRKYPARFTIIDSVSYIEVHLNDGVRTNVCPKIRKLIHTGVRDCANILKYCGGKELKDGFICSIESCKCAAIPYEDDPTLALCTCCSCDMTLTNGHTDWLGKEGPTQVSTSMAASSSSQLLSELVVQVVPQLEDHTFTHKNILSALKEVVDWKSLGIQLDIKLTKIKEIDVNNRGQVADCRYDLVQFWLESDTSCSWKKLIDALSSCDHVVLAEQLKTKTLCTPVP